MAGELRNLRRTTPEPSAERTTALPSAEAPCGAMSRSKTGWSWAASVVPVIFSLLSELAGSTTALFQRLHSHNNSMTELVSKSSRDLANMTLRHPSGGWRPPCLLSAPSPCPSRGSLSPGKAQPERKGTHSSRDKSPHAHTEICRKNSPRPHLPTPPMSVAQTPARCRRQSMSWPSALSAAEPLGVCLIKMLSPASCGLTLKSTVRM